MTSVKASHFLLKNFQILSKNTTLVVFFGHLCNMIVILLVKCVKMV